MLFGSTVGAIADTFNEAGGRAYRLSDYHALLQLAATGCVNSTFYADATTQLTDVLKLARGVEPERVAKIAVFARERGYMKDMPALLCAYLTAIKRTDLLAKIWDRVIDNGKMLRTYIQIIRSGVTGRKSLGTAPKKLIWKWFADRNSNQIFRSSVGNDPSLSDVIKMTHPKPTDKEKEALFGWLLDKKHDATNLPPLVTQFEEWKRRAVCSSTGTDVIEDTPAVPFEMLTALPLSTAGWTNIARNAKWQWTRMNISTMMRHGVFADLNMVQLIAKRLMDRDQILGAKVFPYQLMNAFINCDPNTPADIKRALEVALEISTENVPSFDGKVYVAVDVSGSMDSPVTGSRGSSTTKVKCVDVAGLMAAVIKRRNPSSEVICFDGAVRPCTVNGDDSVMVNARKFAMKGGSTNCAAPLAKLNAERAEGAVVIYLSDNQSWVDSLTRPGRNTGMVAEWKKFKDRNPDAKLVCIDMQPNTTTQVPDSKDVLNVGGFSDSVFDIVNLFVNNQLTPNHWCGEIDKIEI
jgi:60 kDa SS-A/Ro ribonucleoprotein